MNRRSRIKIRKRQERASRLWSGYRILQQAYNAVNAAHQERANDYRAQIALLDAMNYVRVQDLDDA